jgi:tetratricopeptide (TPR) repeat protein
MKHFFVIAAFAALFSSCVSLQQKDMSINSHKDQREDDLAKLEAVIVPLEAMGGAEARRQQSEIASARQMIVNMEKDAAADADYSGKLIAWSGRLAILEGRYSEALRLHRQSLAVSSGNIPSIILGIRLEGDPQRRLELVERELAIVNQNSAGFGELQIERGRSLMELNRFSEAAGAFDAAFSSDMNGVYSQSYGSGRNRAWELRNSGGASAGTLDMLRDTVKWSDCIAIAKNETQLLRFISGGRDIGDGEFFNRLFDRAFIPNTQDISAGEWPRAKPRADETVTRSGAAWLIWHLYAEARADRGLLSRYSTRYATGANPRSPIADVPPLSPFFDSILGCVETELMSLPDGRNFRPDQPIRGAELLSILRKIDN